MLVKVITRLSWITKAIRNIWITISQGRCCPNLLYNVLPSPSGHKPITIFSLRLCLLQWFTLCDQVCTSIPSVLPDGKSHRSHSIWLSIIIRNMMICCSVAELLTLLEYSPNKHMVRMWSMQLSHICTSKTLWNKFRFSDSQKPPTPKTFLVKYHLACKGRKSMQCQCHHWP